jgi:hypothetical protein
MKYDPERAPEPKAWLSLDEKLRIRACEEAHAEPPTWHPPIKSPTLHAGVHVVVENQLALGQPPQVRTALERLVAQGLNRHEAIHEIGRLVSEVILDVTQQKRPFDGEAYAAALDGLRGRVTPRRS